MSPRDSHRVDSDFVTSTLRDLVRINSVNPFISPAGAGEGEIARYLQGLLGKMGLEVSVYERTAGRPSVVAVLPGRGNGPSLMFNAHVDTVGVEEMQDPFSGAVREGKLFGRGSYDMKGSLAASIGAVKALVDHRAALSGSLVVAAVADEEYASAGTEEVIENCRVDAAIVTEPTGLDVCVAHKGFVWLKVETRGRAAHGSRFDEGMDANIRMGRFLAELEKLEKALRARTPHPLVGLPSLHAPLLQGGSGLSTYAASCALSIERRTVPGETGPQVLRELQEILDRLKADDASFQGEVTSLLVREPFEARPDSRIVSSLESVASRLLGAGRPRRVGQSPWMDAALLQSAGVDTVVIGPSGAGAHSSEEWVDVQSVVDLACILAETALDYCGCG